jgi:hypothetical protein
VGGGVEDEVRSGSERSQYWFLNVKETWQR